MDSALASSGSSLVSTRSHFTMGYCCRMHHFKHLDHLLRRPKDWGCFSLRLRLFDIIFVIAEVPNDLGKVIFVFVDSSTRLLGRWTLDIRSIEIDLIWHRHEWASVLTEIKEYDLFECDNNKIRRERAKRTNKNYKKSVSEQADQESDESHEEVSM